MIPYIGKQICLAPGVLYGDGQPRLRAALQRVEHRTRLAHGSEENMSIDVFIYPQGVIVLRVKQWTPAMATWPYVSDILETVHYTIDGVDERGVLVSLPTPKELNKCAELKTNWTVSSVKKVIEGVEEAQTALNAAKNKAGGWVVMAQDDA